MMKRLFNIALVVALFSSIAMAQERSEEVVVEGPDTVAGEAGPAPRRCTAGPRTRCPTRR